jgi:hypothetical protein
MQEVADNKSAIVLRSFDRHALWDADYIAAHLSSILELPFQN